MTAINAANLEPIREALSHEGLHESQRLLTMAFDEYVLYKLEDPANVGDPESHRVAYLLLLLKNALQSIEAQA